MNKIQDIEDNLLVRDVVKPSGYAQIIDMQREAWGMSGKDLVRENALNVLTKNGLLLAIYEPSTPDRLLGYVMGFNSNNQKLLSELQSLNEHVPDHLMKPVESYANIETKVHYSHMMAMRKKVKGKGIGLQLKLAQRERVMGEVDKMEWTCDPLLSINAKLNIHKLGATVKGEKNYLEDCYGDNVSGTYNGLPSDRLLTEWDLTKDPTNSKATLEEHLKAGTPQVITAETYPVYLVNHQGTEYRHLKGITLHEDSEVLVEIPNNFNDYRVEKYDGLHENRLRLPWRLAIREVMQNYLKKGYAVTDLLVGLKGTTHYLLEK